MHGEWRELCLPRGLKDSHGGGACRLLGSAHGRCSGDLCPLDFLSPTSIMWPTGQDEEWGIGHRGPWGVLNSPLSNSPFLCPVPPNSHRGSGLYGPAEDAGAQPRRSEAWSHLSKPACFEKKAGSGSTKGRSGVGSSGDLPSFVHFHNWSFFSRAQDREVGGNSREASWLAAVVCVCVCASPS